VRIRDPRATYDVAKQERPVAFIEIRLVIWPASIDAIKVKRRIAIVCERIWIVLLLKRAVGIERQIMIDELSKVRVQSRNSAFFRVESIFRFVESRRHLRAKILEVVFILRFGRTKLSSRKRPEHATKSSLELRRPRSRHQTSKGHSMHCGHVILPQPEDVGYYW
jgi:hypothetical protein